jgi:hypothetical protein
MLTLQEYSLDKREPVLVGEVVRDLIDQFKSENIKQYGRLV